jgi:RES domain-containing protein
LKIRAFRLTKSTRVSSALSGDGAWKYGGRWNSPGRRVVYASSTLSLAMLEIMVHLDDYATLCKSYSFIPLEIPSELVTGIELSALAEGWNASTVGAASQQVGDAWAFGKKSAVLAVPTVLAPRELNYLINPEHPEFRRITIGKPEQLCFDPRFIKP